MDRSSSIKIEEGSSMRLLSPSFSEPLRQHNQKMVRTLCVALLALFIAAIGIAQTAPAAFPSGTFRRR